jgi:Domain of unknown function (DUF4340)
MKGKTFLILLAAAGVLVALSFLRFGDEKKTGAVKMGDKLFASLPVNQVAGVTIADSENRVTLVRGEKVWQVDERNGYPADFNALRDTVVKLSRLKIGRSFSASPESLARLSLKAPAAEDAQGTGKQITLTDPSGNVLGDVILGQTRQSDSGGAGGQYLKKVGGEAVFLVDGDFQFLKTAPADWLQEDVLDIKSETIASVTCYSGETDKPVFALDRPAKGEAPRMTPVPAGRKADSAKIDQVFDALAPLTLDDVMAVDGKPPTGDSDRFRLVYRLYDGRQITIFPAKDGKGTHTLRITAGEANTKAVAAAPAEPSKADAEEEKAANGETNANGDGGKNDARPQAPVKTAQQLNEELTPWVFVVKQWQFDSFITGVESLLEEVKKEGDGNS